MDGVLQSTEACSKCPFRQQSTERIEQLTRRLRTMCRNALRSRMRESRMQSTIARLEQELREAKGEARPTARNSSVAPSANPPGAPKPVVKKPSGRPSGAQMGHKGHGRRLLPPDRVDRFVQYRPTQCEGCRAELSPLPTDQVVARHQQAELPQPAVQITEHQAVACRCPRCGQVSRGEIPDSIQCSVCGPRLSAAMGYLSAFAHVSRRGVEQILHELLGMELSLGSVCAREKELSQALAEPYERIKQEVRQAPVKYVDETGWNGAASWLWVAATVQTVLFLCSRGRTGVELVRLLGKKLVGVICSDRCGVYSKYPSKRRGLCWAHLKRDFQRCIDRGSTKIGQELLAITREVFHRWRWFRRGKISRAALQRQLQPLRQRMRQALELGAHSDIAKTAGLCRRLLKLEGPMWRFADVAGLEPTNNLAERMLRQAVIWRKTSMGSDSPGGCRFVERMLSVTATLRLRRRSVMDYLAAAVMAHRQGRPAPSLKRLSKK